MRSQIRYQVLTLLLALLSASKRQAMEANRAETNDFTRTVSAFAKLPAEIVLLVAHAVDNSESRIRFARELLGDSEFKCSLSPERETNVRGELEKIIALAKYSLFLTLSDKRTQARLGSELLKSPWFASNPPESRPLKLILQKTVNTVDQLGLCLKVCIWARKDQSNEAIQLIEQGAAFEQGLRSTNLLIDAVSRGKVRIVQALIEAQINLNSKNEFAETALIIATKLNNQAAQEIVKLLIKAGAQLDHQTLFRRLNALMYAAYLGNEKNVRFLLEAGAALNLTDREDRTALELAREKGHTNIVGLLEKAALDRELELLEI